MSSSSWGKIRIPFYLSLFILILAAGFFLYKELRGGVDLGVKLPDGEMEIGVPFEVELTLVNNSANTLKDVRLELDLPSNILLVDKPDEKILSRGIGDMVNGRIHRETFRVVAVPGENPDYKIKSAVYYVPASISASLQKREETEIKLKAPTVSLELNAPERIFSGEELAVRAAYKSSLEPRDGNYSLALKINYPSNFTVTSRTPSSTGEDSSWRLEDTGMHEGNVVLYGNIELSDDATFSLTAELVMKIQGKEYPVTSNIKNIAVNPSPLVFRISQASGKETVTPGEELTYLLQYKNSSTVSLEDVVISAKLTGDMFDMGTLETAGAADVLAGTLLWSPTQVKQLEILEPGEGGQVSFAIKVKEGYPGQEQNRRNSVLKVDGRIESPTVPPPLNLKKIVNLSSLETKVSASSSR